MSFSVVWTEYALTRMEVLTDFIAAKSPIAAYRIIDDLFDRAAILGDQPEIGHALPTLNEPTIRVMYFGVYRLIYLVDHDARCVSVLTAQHGKELPLDEDDLRKLLDNIDQ